MPSARGTFDAPDRKGATWSAVRASRLPSLLEEYASGLAGASPDATFRSYTGELVGGLPAEASGARTIIACVVPARHAIARVRAGGETVALPLPSGYWDDGIKAEDIAPGLRAAALSSASSALTPVSGALPMKLLAAKCGLVRYGRNSVAYAEGLGSVLAIRAFATDEELEEGPWAAPLGLEECEGCRACVSLCPTGAIRPEGFRLDAGRCLSLFNEIEGAFPLSVAGAAHNALMGCLRCQASCPANRSAPPAVELEALDEAESAALLAGDAPGPLLASISAKLRLGSPGAAAAAMAALSRNLRAFLAASGIRER